MAIYYFQMRLIARRSGGSAVVHAAYIAAERLTNERDGLTYDFTWKRGVEHTEIALPDGANADWARDRSALWNAAERAERRIDARVAREFGIALPHELTAEQRLALTREFARNLAERYGAAVDFAIHRADVGGDARNTHAHVMMTTRVVSERGLSEKTQLERNNEWLIANHMPTSRRRLKELRQAWEDLANRHLAIAGLDIRIDHRSLRERGLKIKPTKPVGVLATRLERRGIAVLRTKLDEAAARRNADLICNKPEQVLTLITYEKSVFDRFDIAQALHRYINDSQTFQNAFASVMASKALVELQPEQLDVHGRSGEARYSTAEMIAIEAAIADNVAAMNARDKHGVLRRHVETAIADQDRAISGNGSSPGQGLSAQQRWAIEHVTGSRQIAVVVGFAGAGKSSMLSAARQAWEAQGYRVHGAALSGKAAEGLEQSSGILSRTLASWEYSWQADRNRLNRSDVFVIDEAGMVGSRQLARFVEEIKKAGGKLVLVGDDEQLQAIGAGAPFRAIVEAVGYAQLSEVRRQRADWQKQASIDFASHRTKAGLSAYQAHGHVHFKADRREALKSIVADYVMDRASSPDKTRIAMAHRRKDVHAINAGIRTVLQEQGELAKGMDGSDDLGRELTYQTNDGTRAFAPGDRIVFLANDRDLNVKNGMLGEVVSVEPDTIQVRLDGKTRGSDGQRHVTIPVKTYQAFDHGYATTIHKTQGTTVDRGFVLASTTMDRHLTYVAMTRHRDEVKLYAGLDDFKTMRSLTETLGRSGAKETTLDYTRAFANRRGLDLHGTNSRLELASVATTREDPGSRRDPVAEPKRHEQLAPTPGVSLNNGHGGRHDDDRRPVLVPAIATYQSSVEAAARSHATPAFEREWEVPKSWAPRIFSNARAVMEELRKSIVDRNADPTELAKQLSSTPEKFGALVGRTGLLGNNAERRQAINLASALAFHVEHCGKTWHRRLAAEYNSETWQREKRDVIEIRGFSKQSEAMLQNLETLSITERGRFVEQMKTTLEGRQALDEAKDITTAIEKRFARANPSDLAEQLKRTSPGQTCDIGYIRQVARLADLSHRAELTQEFELKRSLTRGQGLGLGT
ncbi:Ti-type conjugative transfer relaxase TraA [Rhizobium mesoamericanum]|uniref:Putative conjugal transfer protein TraA n=1 Tax=Rhizobium mesoamericanum STM3625 TaxID=1211777 RepID=K0Q2P8_9HYPH|nr:Ti-type conjugative transfer relaxase TraA [Rhizobium mesoamericanum]CCM76819.1 putative conjugal transfer protein TraA [Rhizobium mesoamericanum STM3625]